MSAKGYCTAVQVETFMGLSFTTAQFAHCDDLIERAEKFVDEETNRGWLMGELEGERFYNPPPHIFLRYAPIESIEAITGRTGLGEDEVELTEDVDYELMDLEAGHIYLVTPGSYDRVLVDYTPATAVPADITQATVELVATWMQGNLQPGSYGLDSIQLPDYTVRFARSHVQEAAPPTVQQVLDRYRFRVHA